MKTLLKGNKLVRDKIPEIINSNGCKCNFRELDDASYLSAIKDKILEESKELLEAKTKKEKIEELADLYEILEAFAKAEDISQKEISTVKESKKEKRGAFEKKIYLEEYEKDL